MGLFDLFRGLVQEKAEEPELPAPRQEEDELEIYSGMRVEVTTFDGQLLFVAKLIGPREGRAQLHQYSESFSHQGEEEPVRVRIRGYHDHARKAVYMEGTISVLPERKWQVEELVVARIGNDRAFFRLDTNVDATATIMGGRNAGEKACKLLNISVGGACIASAYPFQEGDKFLLKVKLLEDLGHLGDVLPGPADNQPGGEQAHRVWLPVPGAERVRRGQNHPEYFCRPAPAAERRPLAGAAALGGPQ